MTPDAILMNMIHTAAQNSIVHEQIFKSSIMSIALFTINVIISISTPLTNVQNNKFFISCNSHLFLLIILANVSKSCTELNNCKVLLFQSK